MAEDGINRAIKIDRNNERTEFLKNSASTENWIPSMELSLFTACDVRINNENWRDDKGLEDEFNGYWIESLKYNVPNVWPTPLKLAVISDINWTNRKQEYVMEIAKDLYLNLSPSTFTRMRRMINSELGGFKLDFEKMPMKLLLIFFLFCITPDLNSSPINYIENNYLQQIEYTKIKMQENIQLLDNKSLEAFNAEYFSKEECIRPIIDSYKILIKDTIDFDHNDSMSLALISMIDIEDI